jgi:glycyl-tRNA synthetase beta chain
MSTRNLLVELFVEELPPKALKKLGESFAIDLWMKLADYSLVDREQTVEIGKTYIAFASPRRLAVWVKDALRQAPDRAVRQKLMPVSVGLDADDQPTPALLKKLGALGLDASVVRELKREGEGKAETLFFDSTVKGATLADGLQKALEDVLAKLPIPKVMTYQLADGWSSVNFVRPAHGLVALHGVDVVPVSVLGLTAGRETQGHRFEAGKNPVSVESADSYEAQLEGEGAVIPGFEKRRDEIARQLEAAAAEVGGGVQPIEDAALLDEVTALVERPNVLPCQFEEQFLQVPQECLILTMKANQKYFPLLDGEGRLTNKFLIVSNIRPADPSAVIGGNERVVRPRLADAKFFYDQDRKKTLASRVGALDKIVYHNKLGSQGARVGRLVKLAGAIARELGANAALAERAALLAKADLVTDMVGEFPELQGTMGRYYALHDGEELAVADAIEQHYKPKFAGDTLPEGNVALAVALAERLDTLVGMFGIGAVPTGDKDPFALRRAALGVLRLLMERYLPLDLMQLLEWAQAQFDPEQIAASTAVDVFQFMQERLRVYLRERGALQDEVESVVVQAPTRIDRVPARLAAVAEFRRLPESAALAAANKRIGNILKKAGNVGDSVDISLLQEGAESDLHKVMLAVAPAVDTALAELDYTTALTRLAGVRSAVDRFFDEVMVMAEEPLIRANRLALLGRLSRTMNCVADIAELTG